MIAHHTTQALRRSAPTLAGLWLGAMMIAAGQAQALPPVEVVGNAARANVPDGATLEKRLALRAPRLISFGPEDEMFIGSQAGRLYRLQPPYDRIDAEIPLSGYPHSAVVHDGYLYVATTDHLYRTAYTPGQDVTEVDFEGVADLPGGGGHASRSLSVGPDGRLYVALGLQGNCSAQRLADDVAFEDRRGGVMALDPTHETPGWTPYVSGLRNPIGMAWSPQGILYLNNNGPDHWGYEAPPELLVRAESGSFHGMPWYQWNDDEWQRDTCIDSAPPAGRDTLAPPVATFAARSAPIGLTFLPEDNPWQVDMVSAIHGSWATQASGGRATRRPPKIVGIRLDDDGRQGQMVDLVSGFQAANGERWARPAGVAYHDGALYFTADDGDTGLYRLTP
ncbi:glucose/sorbosone dehydrogenase [Chromohalobacter marismortui]|uniref:Glucose/sorbosone dehydrogenase n=1 Tax=Chromohalobacter marismortui TaxID=42055 RepID=A0A4V3F423_9GAMM|nr:MULTISPECIES: PQQ-dependent sugar dehydrogenase [Chromohalobacter]MCI0511327.1 PQQ-dependent sugar dehydrogenase [Chromohalobacter sp.]MCI0594061.1 PQQ-dependent sugar dehydrogenase [Chromohalobacter sp.]TDU23656.1 glucose/sorbosone dehydrogenase [Chromohalobacter marismortui]